MLLVGVVLAGCGRFGYDAHGADAAPYPGDYCAGIPALAAAPVIDGVLEPGVLLAGLLPVGWAGEGAAVPAGQSAAFAVSWRPDGLYFYVAVVDPTRLPAVPEHYSWCGDGVEVYIDSDGRYPIAPDYDDPGTRQMTTAAPGDDVTPERRGEAWCFSCGEGSPQVLTSTDFIATPRPDGYALEMFVVAADLGLDAWSLSAGTDVGFDLSVNVSQEEPTANPCRGSNAGNRRGQYFLRIADNDPPYPFNNAAAFCSASLLD